MSKPIYTRGNCSVFEAHTTKPMYLKREKKWIPKGTKYYTVVNTKLQVHRHYIYERQAFFICKRAGTHYVPQHYNNKAKKDILYLITGDESVYSNKK